MGHRPVKGLKGCSGRLLLTSAVSKRQNTLAGWGPLRRTSDAIVAPKGERSRLRLAKVDNPLIGLSLFLRLDLGELSASEPIP